MFTGIVEDLGVITKVVSENDMVHFRVESALSHSVKIDQSVAHDGVCLTVTACDELGHQVTAVHETLQKTNLSEWREGRQVNLERAMLLGSRLDGHIVQGHVDTVATCIAINDTDGKRLYKFQFSPAFSALIIEKGSICVNGVSLTAFNVALDTFDVTIIPYTYDHTTFKSLNVGDHVNIEFDILGKYLLRHQTVSLANESRH